MRTIVAYFILASIWIVASGSFLVRSLEVQSETAVIQTLNGLNFVITSAVLLLFVLRHACRSWRRAEQQRVVGIGHEREKFRSLSSHIQALREKDRTSIAREIHDELGQLLTGIQMQLRLIENRLADRDDRSLNPVIDKLVETSELVDTTIASVQRISAGLRPSALDTLGLAAALSGEAEIFSQRSGVPCTLGISKIPKNLPAEVATTAFRIFQEALTNVARHAKARHVDADISIRNQLLRLVVHDDGCGIDPAVVEDPKSLGLIGMLERAEHVGGRVVFSRDPQRGSLVTLTIPLATAAPATSQVL